MKKKIIYHNRHTLSYAEFGDPKGFPILIQHGLIAAITDRSLFAGLIDAGTRLICIARPGYGHSSPYAMRNIAEWGEIISDLIAELKLAQFDVLGMSSGAPYCYAIGCRFPEQARNLFIFSGIPALYDAQILSFWPYPVNKRATLPELQKLAYDLFFANLPAEELARDDIQDSMKNDCFGLALDFKLRCQDWGFSLQDVRQPVTMRHARGDGDSFVTAEMTAKLLPNCQFLVRENDIHFSKEELDCFIDTVMVKSYSIL